MMQWSRNERASVGAGGEPLPLQTNFSVVYRQLGKAIGTYTLMCPPDHQREIIIVRGSMPAGYMHG